MRKLLVVLLGLLLLAGAVGAFSYRWVIEPSRTAAQATRPLASSPQTRALPTAPSASASRQPAPQQKVSAFNIFEIALNVANLLVGGIGIWLAMRGMRATRT